MQKTLRSFKDLYVWQKAFKLTLLIYQITKAFPREELYGVISQMRRASVSIVSNIAEGYSRKGRMEYVQFLSISYGSLSELETQFLLSHELGYIKKEQMENLSKVKDEVGGMLYKLIQKINSEPRTQNPIP